MMNRFEHIVIAKWLVGSALALTALSCGGEAQSTATRRAHVNQIKTEDVEPQNDVVTVGKVTTAAKADVASIRTLTWDLSGDVMLEANNYIGTSEIYSVTSDHVRARGQRILVEPKSSKEFTLSVTPKDFESSFNRDVGFLLYTRDADERTWTGHNTVEVTIGSDRKEVVGAYKEIKFTPKSSKVEGKMLVSTGVGLLEDHFAENSSLSIGPNTDLGILVLPVGQWPTLEGEWKYELSTSCPGNSGCVHPGRSR